MKMADPYRYVKLRLNLIGGIAIARRRHDPDPPAGTTGRRSARAGVLLSTIMMEQRTVGIIWTEITRDFSNVGPMVRASGHATIPVPITRLLVMACQWKSSE